MSNPEEDPMATIVITKFDYERLQQLLQTRKTLTLPTKRPETKMEIRPRKPVK